MAIILEAITHVWFAGRMINPGEVFSADDEYGKKLIKGKSAKVHKAVEKKQSSHDPSEELKKPFMALKLDDLKALSLKNNVTLAPDDNTKPAITQKLIQAGVRIE